MYISNNGITTIPYNHGGTAGNGDVEKDQLKDMWNHYFKKTTMLYAITNNQRETATDFEPEIG